MPSNLGPESQLPDWFEEPEPLTSPEAAGSDHQAGSRRRAVVLASAVLLGLLVAGGVIVRPSSGEAPASSLPPASAHPPADQPSTPQPTATTTVQPEQGEALTVLGSLAVKGRASSGGYDRDLFGQAWADVDRNGCDTRNDVLRRDLRDVVLKADSNGCAVLAGVLDDPYTAEDIDFRRGSDTSLRVQIDHVIALSAAWKTGAQRWSPAKLESFANDPLELLAVDGPENQSKSDGDAATWLPPNKAYRCTYIARQIAIKAKYALWVTPPEHAAMVRVLTKCPNEPLPAVEPIELG